MTQQLLVCSEMSGMAVRELELLGGSHRGGGAGSPGVGAQLPALVTARWLRTNATHKNQFASSSGIPNHLHVGTGPPPQFNRMEEMVKHVAYGSGEAEPCFDCGLE